MRVNAVGSGGAAATTALCISMALPTMICAPPVPPSGGDASEAMPRRYLRHVHHSSDDSLLSSLASFLRSTTDRDGGIDAAVGHEIIDLGDEGGDQIVDLSRTNEGVEDGSERRLQRRTSEKWYVNWYESKCVQSCPPTSENPHCGGPARWDQKVFDTADNCCEVALGWQPLEDCSGRGHSDSFMTTLTVDGDNGEGGDIDTEGRSDDYCPPEYSTLDNYVALDLVTIYITETKGQIYMCKEDPLARYCDLFRPDWSRTAPGGGSVHTTDQLGWKLLAECDGTQVSLLAPELEEEEEEDEKEEEMHLNGVSPADSGLWPEGSPPMEGPSSANMPAMAPAPDADGQLSSNFPALSVGNGGGKKPPGKKPPGSASKPAGKAARPPRPPKPPSQGAGGSPTVSRPLPLGISGSWPTPAGAGGRPPSATPGSDGSNGGPIGSIGFGTGGAAGDGSGPSNAVSGSDPSSSLVGNGGLPPNNEAGTPVGAEGADSSPPANVGSDFPLIGNQPSNGSPSSGHGEGTSGLVAEEGASFPSAGAGTDQPPVVDKPENVVTPSGDGDGTSGPDAEGGASSSSSTAPGTDYPLIGNKPANDGPSSGNGDETSGLDTGASSPSTTGKDPPVGKQPGKPKPSPSGNQGDGGDSTDGDGSAADSIRPIPDDGEGTAVSLINPSPGDDTAASSIRPKPHRPGKPFRPFKPKPKPGEQVQEGPDPSDGDDEEDEEDIIELNGRKCWRSGRHCRSDAEIFACCTRCIRDLCE